MITTPVIFPLAKIIIIFIPSILMILLLSKLFPMADKHIVKINITYIHIISNKLIHNSVNSLNSPFNSKFSMLRSILNPTMIISMLPLQPISKFIDHLIHLLIHKSQLSYNFISPSLWYSVIA